MFCGSESETRNVHALQRSPVTWGVAACVMMSGVSSSGMIGATPSAVPDESSPITASTPSSNTSLRTTRMPTSGLPASSSKNASTFRPRTPPCRFTSSIASSAPCRAYWP